MLIAWCAWLTDCNSILAPGQPPGTPLSPIQGTGRWGRCGRGFPSRGVRKYGQRRADESQVAELERKVGRQALEIDFLQRCLQHVEEQRKRQALDIRSSSTRTSKRK